MRRRRRVARKKEVKWPPTVWKKSFVGDKNRLEEVEKSRLLRAAGVAATKKGGSVAPEERPTRLFSPGRIGYGAGAGAGPPLVGAGPPVAGALVAGPVPVEGAGLLLPGVGAALLKSKL